MLENMNPCPRGHEISILVGRPFLGHYYYVFSLSDLCPEYRKIFLKKDINFTSIPPPNLEWAV